MFLIVLTEKVLEKRDCRRKRGHGLCDAVIVVETYFQIFDAELLGRGNGERI